MGQICKAICQLLISVGENESHQLTYINNIRNSIIQTHYYKQSDYREIQMLSQIKMGGPKRLPEGVCT